MLLDVCCWSVLPCVDCVLPVCDARYKRYLGDIGKDLLEKNQSLFLEEKSRDIMLKTGKLLH